MPGWYFLVNIYAFAGGTPPGGFGAKNSCRFGGGFGNGLPRKPASPLNLAILLTMTGSVSPGGGGISVFVMDVSIRAGGGGGGGIFAM
jgi:hypothetical protein